MNTKTYDSNRPQEISCGLTYKKGTPQRWGERRYYALDYYLKQNFGEKLYKISLNGGCSCPNRDGTCGTRGCIFCSEGGSGDFAASSSLSVADQLAYGKGLVRPKYNGHSYIAYFQAYTNTYAPVEVLKEKYLSALSDPKIEGLVIGTRPDCLSDEVLSLLSEINRDHFLWLELGLQTIHEKTSAELNICYGLSAFDEACKKLNDHNIRYVVHLILGLPGETSDMMLESVRYVAQKPGLFGMKLHLLNIVKGSAMERTHIDYQPFSSIDSYVDTVCRCLEIIPPQITIHRLTGDAPRSILINPPWSFNKRTILNRIDEQLNLRDTWQGKKSNNI